MACTIAIASEAEPLTSSTAIGGHEQLDSLVNAEFGCGPRTGLTGGGAAVHEQVSFHSDPRLNFSLAFSGPSAKTTRAFGARDLLRGR